MNRRLALTALAGAAGGVMAAANVRGAEPSIPGAIALKLDEKVQIGAQSTPVKVDTTDLHIVSIGTATFHLDRDSRLTVKLNAAVTQYAKVDYWISLAVFDVEGRLLGTASHKEPVQYIRLGAIPTMLPEIKLDFGISKSFGKAALVAVSISDRDVPKPG